jgi:peptidyl-prolyl cis-trans isomerase D
MLQFIRSRVTSIFVKVLFVLLIVSFAIWGIGDIFLGRQSGQVAVSVGSTKIMSEEILDRFDQARQRLNIQITAQEAARFGLLDGVIQEAVIDGLFAAEGQDLGIGIGDDLIRSNIAATAAFRDSTGQFSADAFSRALFNARLSEQQYVAMLRHELTRGQIVGAAVAGIEAPSPLVDALFDYRRETRSATVVRLPFAAIANLPAPDEATLKDFHEKNPKLFEAPALRDLTWVAVSAEDLAGEILIPEDALREEYTLRKDRLTVPERRDVDQIFFADEKTATAAHERIAAGESLADVAKEVAGTDAGALSLGKLTRADLTETALQDAVFGATAGTPTKPVKSSLGWHIFLVKEVEPGSVKSFEAARDEIRLDLARDKAIDAMFKITNQLEDELAGGRDLEGAAGAMSLKLHKVAGVDARGRDINGKAVPGLPAGPNFLAAAFATPEGQQSPLGETAGNGHFLLRVDKVTPPAVRSLADVRERATDLWLAEQRRQAARAQGEAIVEKAKGGVGLAKAAEAAGLSTATLAPFARSGDDLPEGYPQELPAVVFGLAVGMADIAESDTEVVVAEVNEIVRPKPDGEAEAVTRIKGEVSGGVANDVVDTLVAALRAKHKVEIDRSMIDRLVQGGQ